MNTAHVGKATPKFVGEPTKHIQHSIILTAPPKTQHIQDGPVPSSYK